MYYNDSDQARESGLRRAFVESMQELMKCVNTLAAGAAEKAYCYLNLCGMDVFTGCFFVDRDGKASLAPALLGEKQKIFETVMTTQARKLRGAYIEYADDIPGEFFLDFDIGAKKPHCLTGKEKYPKHDEALLHFYSWAREYGADGIIYQQVKFCDPWAYERLLGSTMLRDDYGFPVMSVDRPYNIASSVGQMRTRVQAFVESIEIKKLQGGAR